MVFVGVASTDSNNGKYVIKGNFMNVNNPLPAKFLHSENVSKGFAYLKTHLDSLLEATSPSRLLGNTSEGNGVET